MQLHKYLWSGYLFFHTFGQKKIPFTPTETWKKLQKNRLKQIIAHAYESVPFYRSYMIQNGLRPEDFKSVEDLQNLPLISKKIVREKPESFFSTHFKKNQCFELRTTGTTGEPTSFWHDQRSLILNIAYGERERSAITRLLKKNSAVRTMVFRYPGSTFEKVQRFYNQNIFRPNWALPKRVIVSTANPLSQNIELLNQYKPDIVQAFGSYLGFLFRYAARHQKKFHQPKIVLYSADKLSEPDRQLIKKNSNIHILSYYSTCEALKIGFMCEVEEGFHLHSDLCALSLINEKKELVKPGERGEVVVSNLVNRAMVLLNYQLGDLAIINTRPCECGRTFPLLQSIEGRKLDFIHLPNGDIIDPTVIWGKIFKLQQEVVRYQVIQKEQYIFMVKVLPSQDTNRKKLADELQKKFKKVFGDSLQFHITFVDTFPVFGRNKFRTLIANPKYS